MAERIIATAGATDANSFCTLAEAITILTDVLNADAFLGAEQAVQETALLQATRLLVVRVEWDLPPATGTQALPWPQRGAVDGMGRPLSATVVPLVIKQAEALYALALLQEAASGVTPADLAMIESFAIAGQASVTFGRGRPALALESIPGMVRELIAPYGAVHNGNTMRLLRA